MSKLLQIGIVGAVLYYLWDQQQKKGGNGQQTAGNGQQCESDIAKAKKLGWRSKRACTMAFVTMLCPYTGKTYSVSDGCVATELSRMGWKRQPIKEQLPPIFQQGTIFQQRIPTYNSLIGLEGELL